MSTANVISCTLHYDFLKRQRRLEYRPNVCRMETDSGNNRVLSRDIQLSGICIGMSNASLKGANCSPIIPYPLELSKTFTFHAALNWPRCKEKRKSRVINTAQYRFTFPEFVLFLQSYHLHTRTRAYIDTMHNITKGTYYTHIDNL